MADKKPIRAVFNDSNVATGLAEFQSGDTVGLTHGGLGVSLSIGSAGQVLKVNSGASALEFGNVEAVVNIDNATDLTSATLATTDLLLASDGGTEGRVTLAQLDTLFSGTSKTLTNKTLTTPTITTPIINAGAQLKNGSTSAGFLEFFEDSDNGTNKATLIGPASTADVTITLPAATDTLVGKATTDTLTNKTLTSPKLNEDVVLSATATELNLLDGVSGLVQADFTKLAAVDATATELNIVDGDTSATSTTVASGDRVVYNDAGTMKQVDVDDIDTYFSATSKTLTNKTITSPTVSGLALSDSSIVFEGSSADNNETTLTVTNPDADRTITLPNATGNVVVFSAASAVVTDGNAGQALTTDGSGNLSFATVGANFPESTFTEAPGSEGDFDLSFNPAQTAQETPFEDIGNDAFGVATDSTVFSCSDPSGSISTVDLGAFS